MSNVSNCGEAWLEVGWWCNDGIVLVRSTWIAGLCDNYEDEITLPNTELNAPLKRRTLSRRGGSHMSGRYDVRTFSIQSNELSGDSDCDLSLSQSHSNLSKHSSLNQVACFISLMLKDGKNSNRRPIFFFTLFYFYKWWCSKDDELELWSLRFIFCLRWIAQKRQ